MMITGHVKPSQSEEFVTWLRGYMHGVRACTNPAERMPAWAEPIMEKLADLEPKKMTISNGPFARGGLVEAARSLELRPADAIGVKFGEQTRRAISEMGYGFPIGAGRSDTGAS